MVSAGAWMKIVLSRKGVTPKASRGEYHYFGLSGWSPDPAEPPCSPRPF